mmetsp:Transcript_3379/g.5467  ORF Transcript_3379/g.5467 Transcript_3379/m.5467 type:complete len:312 (+) Transcript_3379:24-959(+)|eukprot:CAMPEP_0168581374 /NCGR_PEP_ID=MMETSP0420-20121227/1361_1 /TAXON_ID=498008 /ORGANISM="Pessonella sp." /LENGTH=311 /DNA_ID=CAMNT_0008615683 /DNA_START=37 /DNA_END=972 /DNA_ORIENTATION=+
MSYPSISNVHEYRGVAAQYRDDGKNGGYDGFQIGGVHRRTLNKMVHPDGNLPFTAENVAKLKHIIDIYNACALAQKAVLNVNAVEEEHVVANLLENFLSKYKNDMMQFLGDKTGLKINQDFFKLDYSKAEERGNAVIYHVVASFSGLSKVFVCTLSKASGVISVLFDDEEYSFNVLEVDENGTVVLKNLVDVTRCTAADVSNLLHDRQFKKLLVEHFWKDYIDVVEELALCQPELSYKWTTVEYDGFTHQRILYDGFVARFGRWVLLRLTCGRATDFGHKVTREDFDENSTNCRFEIKVESRHAPFDRVDK